MSQHKRNSHSRPSLNISTALLYQLTTLPAEVLLHMASYHLVTTGTKAAMARWLFDAIYNSSSIATSLSPSAPPATITIATTLKMSIP